MNARKFNTLSEGTRIEGLMCEPSANSNNGLYLAIETHGQRMGADLTPEQAKELGRWLIEQAEHYQKALYLKNQNFFEQYQNPSK